MSSKTFIVTHPKARSPLTIKGRTLEDALKREGLDPTIWRLTQPPIESEEQTSGDNQGDGGEENN